MTQAICIKCGEGKLGAFARCLHCGYMPEAPADQAKSILLCGHNLDRASLDAMAAKLKAGNALTFVRRNCVAAEFSSCLWSYLQRFCCYRSNWCSGTFARIARPSTPGGDRLDILAALVEAWEEKHHPIGPPDRIEALRFATERRGRA